MRRTIPLLAFLLVGLACPSSAPAPAGALEGYLTALQAGDLASLRCRVDPGVTSPGSDELSDGLGDAEWLRVHVDAQRAIYERGRDLGFVPLDGDPVRTALLFNLGSGAYYEVRRSDRDGSVATLVTEVRLAYSHIDLSRFSPGTTLYFGGAPAGTVETVVVPRFSGEVSVDVLDRIELEWTLEWAEEEAGCPAGWRVVRVEPLEGSERVTDTTWTF